MNSALHVLYQTVTLPVTMRDANDCKIHISKCLVVFFQTVEGVVKAWQFNSGVATDCDV